jgi:hypothetical protein
VVIRSLRFFVLALSICALVGACSSCNKKEEAPPQQNGVNDVKKSCEVRATWQNRTERKCTDCIASAPSPPCNCEQFKEFAGMCAAQGEARRVEPTCTVPLDDCTHKCKDKDCACIDGCYAQADACKRATAAREGCVTEICGRFCM